MMGLIAFFRSPLGLGMLAVVAALVYVRFERNDAAEGAAAECRADVYQQQIEQLQKRAQDAENLAAEMRRAADLAEAEQTQMEKERDAAIVDLRATANECRRFDPATLERLRNIR